jgi:hypothetical protein
MRKTTDALLAACLVIGGVTSVRAGAEDFGNLLSNGGFEEIEPLVIVETAYLDALPGVDEVPAGWMIDYSAMPGMLTVIYDVETSHRGAIYVRLENRGGMDGREVSFLYNKSRVPVEGGKRYVLSVWAKGKGRIELLFHCLGRQDKEEWNKTVGLATSEKLAVSSEEWKEYTFECVLPENAGNGTPRFNIAGVVDLDDAAFRRVNGKIR